MKKLFATSEKEGYFSPDGNYLLYGSRSNVSKYRVIKWHYYNYCFIKLQTTIII